MKNIFLIPLLLNTNNPLNSATVTEDNNQIITQITPNGTNAGNTYNVFLSNTQRIIQITQKFEETTQPNEYAYTTAYNYCQVQLAINNNEDSDQYTFDTFAIVQYTPYRYIATSDIDLHVKILNNIYPISDDNYDGFTAKLDYTIATTTTDLQSLLNTNNWTNFGIDTQTGQYWQTAYTNNDNKYVIGQRQNIPLQDWDDDDAYYNIDIQNVLLSQQNTTYIVMQFRCIYTITWQGTSQRIEPTPDQYTKLLHTNYIEIDSELQPITVTQEIVDIPGLMFQILTLPFTFISQAFDLTIFPGTPYQVNFSNIFLGFIGIAMLLWVLKLILGQADLGQWLGDQKRMHREERLRDKQHKNNMARETARHNRQLQRDATHDVNRHRELQAREKADHTRAMQHKGKR